MKAKSLLAVSVLLPLSSVGAVEERYGNPWVATLTAAISRPHSPPMALRLPVRPERSLVPISGGQNQLELAMYPGSGGNDLVFLLPGVGGMSFEGRAMAWAEQIAANGPDVVVLNNPFSWRYALTTSDLGIVGDVRRDTQELRNQMTNVVSQLWGQGRNYRATHIVGFSLGALYALHLKQLDVRAPLQPPLQRAIAVNPPVFLDSALTLLDRMNQDAAGLPPSERDWIDQTALDLGSQLRERPLGAGFYEGLEQLIPFSNVQMSYLISQSFQMALRDVLLVGQRVQERGVLREPESRWNQSRRSSEAYRWTFQRYIRELVLPFALGGDQTLGEYAASVDLRALEALALRADVHVLHNVDDFLLSSEERAYLQRGLWARRTSWFSWGGHVGNWWSQEHILKMKSLLPTQR